jgi:hypothetical protein
MSDVSAVMALPYIQASQAQKHVTHNEALRVLDVAVQLAVTSRTLAAPPSSPAQGARWIIGSGATGAWAGRVGQIALWDDGTWHFFVPQPGWTAHVLNEGGAVTFDGTGWIAAGLSNPAADRLGVNTAADTTNRLAVASAASLFTHTGDGHQVKINKASASDTGSMLFQTNWSGRAEIGIAGSDDLSVKVSANGTTWFTALSVARATGAVTAAQGLNAGTLTLSGSQVYARSNILGTVSQASGVPTGAVIERGSNANGDWVRFADGTQICVSALQTVDVTTAFGQIFASPMNQDVTMPAAFSTVAGSVALVGTTNAEHAWGSARLSGVSTVRWRAFRPNSVAGNAFRISVIGRWF